MGHMLNKTPPLDSLSGSARNGGRKEGVTNHTLMPVAAKLPGKSPPPKSSGLSPHLLGSGSKIPESQESRMRSQFASPDPSIYSRKNRSADSSRSDGEWWRNEVRPSIPCTPYKSGVGSVADIDKSGRKQSREARHLAEKASQQAIKNQRSAIEEQKRLMGQKEAMLSSLCSDPTLNSYSPETRRTVNIVMDINKKLGLPPANMGHWKLPE